MSLNTVITVPSGFNPKTLAETSRTLLYLSSTKALPINCILLKNVCKVPSLFQSIGLALLAFSSALFMYPLIASSALTNLSPKALIIKLLLLSCALPLALTKLTIALSANSKPFLPLVPLIIPKSLSNKISNTPAILLAKSG